jgi:hypothetical protein
MRVIQRHRALRLLAAVATSALICWAAWHLGAAVLLVLLFVALLLITFALLTIAPDAIAQLRKHHWRWWWRAPGDDGPYWPGTRIPRH